ncbi:UDP-3-O-acyl N-acetylglucosamine deacetylase [Candidatus Terasakiella magnetica]|uniref:UDP-3-O-acyl-N-acetylglucosamine deacetylase n=1 Tax=Candidatus Terasakiella magnetica TaxID=1867952 RepID=A0A1C3RJJ3_9PROT|nr:UDP-3-O-acyl-N-acetylglucosamine deacetylase [Candidatus Terasakiella magnetica]SCA57403.1 UDP-3-O-acyl N-acetylglucosamine deacetylase [Candidatus Terasakiella magnetica]
MTNIKNQKATKALRQKTLKTTINCSGIALHSGEKVSITLKPAQADTGIIFKRVDIAGKGAEIKATYDNVVETTLCTKIGNKDGVTVATIEHIMAAIAGSAIDNLLVEINGPEMPVMDGSSAPFVFLIECAGIVEQDAPRKAIRIEKPVSVEDTERFAGFQPCEGSIYDFTIDFDNPAVARQEHTVHMGRGVFKDELSRARTFGFLHEVEYMRANGLARGGSLDNAVVVSADGVMNEEGLRFQNEFVRHKILDAVGDISLAGLPIIGRYTGICSGHYLNNQLLHALMANQDAWSIVPMTADDLDAAYTEQRKAAKSA